MKTRISSSSGGVAWSPTPAAPASKKSYAKTRRRQVTRTRLARRLALIAELIKAGLSTCIYYTELDGFDTHVNQVGSHPSLLRETGDSLGAFLEDLRRAGEADRVLVLVFSEFGRRLAGERLRRHRPRDGGAGLPARSGGAGRASRSVPGSRGPDGRRSEVRPRLPPDLRDRARPVAGLPQRQGSRGHVRPLTTSLRPERMRFGIAPREPPSQQPTRPTLRVLERKGIPVSPLAASDPLASWLADLDLPELDQAAVALVPRSPGVACPSVPAPTTAWSSHPGARTDRPPGPFGR